MSAHARRRTAPLPKPTVARILTVLAAPTWPRFAVQDLTALTGQSRCHAASRFTASTGLPPYRTARQAIFVEAQRLLRDTHLSVEQVALKVGYNCRSSLVKLFQQQLGMTPTEWRQTTPATAGRGRPYPPE